MAYAITKYTTSMARAPSDVQWSAEPHSQADEALCTARKNMARFGLAITLRIGTICAISIPILLSLSIAQQKIRARYTIRNVFMRRLYALYIHPKI